MIRLDSGKRDRYRKGAISALILFHFCALTLWILPPYSEMIAHSAHAGTLPGRFEQMISHALTPRDGGPVSILSRTYVDLFGLHQYWDFFAPGSVRIHRYLSVCAEIRESPAGKIIECIEPVYQSFDGGVEDAAKPHHGNRSRSFRLVENLIRLNRPDLLDAFSLYWQKKRQPEKDGTVYLVLHEFTLRAGRGNPASRIARRDELIWIAPD
jgi:hypothetical protein